MQTIHSITTPAVMAVGLQLYYASGEDILPAHPFPPHVHEGVELYLLEEGEISFRIEKEVYRLAPGDAVFARPGEIHNCIQNAPSRHKHCCIWLSAEAESLLFSYERFSGEGRHIPATVEEREARLALCRRLLKASKEDNAVGALATLLSLISLLGGRPCAPAEGMPERLRDILWEMEHSPADIKDLSYFTGKYYISPSTLHRLFHKHLGGSPGRYLEGVRLSRARLLLRQGESVAAACTAAGFGDCSGFIRLFRERFGITPLAYQRLSRDGSALQLYVNKERSEE